jgi:hypothetical protein
LGPSSRTLNRTLVLTLCLILHLPSASPFTYPLLTLGHPNYTRPDRLHFVLGNRGN